MVTGNAPPRPRLQLGPGDQYGRLTLLKLVGVSKKSHQLWQCRCTCGRVVTVQDHNLRAGRTRSCGCLREEVRRRARLHGETAGGRTTTEYNTWQHLRHNQRVCHRWRASFTAFLADVGRRPSPHHLLVRTKAGQPLGPQSVAWVLRRDVMRARFERRIRVGQESHTVREWAHIVGLSHATIYNRLAQGWSAKQAIFTPARPGGRPQRIPTDRRPDVTDKT
jgi:hypothetical protein